MEGRHERGLKPGASTPPDGRPFFYFPSRLRAPSPSTAVASPSGPNPLSLTIPSLPLSTLDQERALLQWSTTAMTALRRRRRRHRQTLRSRQAPYCRRHLPYRVPLPALPPPLGCHPYLPRLAQATTPNQPMLRNQERYSRLTSARPVRRCFSRPSSQAGPSVARRLRCSTGRRVRRRSSCSRTIGSQTSCYTTEKGSAVTDTSQWIHSQYIQRPQLDHRSRARRSHRLLDCPRCRIRSRLRLCRATPRPVPLACRRSRLRPRERRPQSCPSQLWRQG